MFIFGILSDYLKVAKVIPVFKKVDQQDVTITGQLSYYIILVN